MTFRNRVDEALQAVELQPSDVAAVELARRYADEIDRWERSSADPEYEGGDGLKDYGPKLLQALDSLGLTPKARRAAARPEGGGAGGASKRNPVDQIRERREQRLAGGA